MSITDSHLGREILEQPTALQRLLSGERANIEQIATAVRERSPEYIILVARGTSDNAARYGQYLFGAHNHLPTGLAVPSLFTLYHQTPKMSNALILAISQSGQSPDIKAVVDEGNRQGALSITITNNVDSPLAEAADHVINMRAEREYAVAASKTYTASLLALAMLSAALADDAQRWDDLNRLPGLVTQVTTTADAIIAACERYRYMTTCVTLSRGYNYATAFEVALKLKELAYILAEPYSTADFKHGPVALVERDFPVMAIIPDGVVAPELETFVQTLKDRSAELIIVSPKPEMQALAQTPLVLPADVPEWMSPLVSVVPGQLFALGLTLVKGNDPDNPRGLNKVTKTN